MAERTALHRLADARPARQLAHARRSRPGSWPARRRRSATRRCSASSSAITPPTSAASGFSRTARSACTWSWVTRRGSCGFRPVDAGALSLTDQAGGAFEPAAVFVDDEGGILFVDAFDAAASRRPARSRSRRFLRSRNARRRFDERRVSLARRDRLPLEAVQRSECRATRFGFVASPAAAAKLSSGGLCRLANSSRRVALFLVARFRYRAAARRNRREIVVARALQIARFLQLPDRRRPRAVQRELFRHRPMLLQRDRHARARLREIEPPVGLIGLGARFAGARAPALRRSGRAASKRLQICMSMAACDCGQRFCAMSARRIGLVVAAGAARDVGGEHVEARRTARGRLAARRSRPPWTRRREPRSARRAAPLRRSAARSVRRSVGSSGVAGRRNGRSRSRPAKPARTHCACSLPSPLRAPAPAAPSRCAAALVIASNSRCASAIPYQLRGDD